MIIGVISDSHRETKVAASAIEWLLARGADLLVHAEGIVAIETLRLLRQSGKPYFAVLGNNDEALTEFKNEFDLYDEPFCMEFAGLRLKIMHHPFYLFDEEPAAQNEADGLNLNAGADRSVNFRRDFGADLVKNSSFNDEANSGTNSGSNCGADRGEILILNSKTAACSANLDSNFNAADNDKILNGARGADENFKNIRSASANLKSGWSSASPNVNLGLNAGADVNSNA
ncbi:metallophosphoesterase family protein, partial [uncultured Campylobacter sp.]|uniref:metallophosphoesterase family protein n=1 Tax=uncultured Campylobacter sp. TaxID=218934 RepID=UPI0026104CBC